MFRGGRGGAMGHRGMKQPAEAGNGVQRDALTCRGVKGVQRG